MRQMEHMKARWKSWLLQKLSWGLTNSTHSVNVVLRPVRQGHVDEKGQARYVDAASRHICADEEAYVTILKGLQVIALIDRVSRIL